MCVTALLLNSGYKRVTDSYIDISEKIEQQELKRVIMFTMNSAVRERSYILLQMLAVTDAFELDDLNQQLGVIARKFIKVREQLLLMSLTKKELRLWEKQRYLTNKNEALQRQISQLIMDGDRSTAHELFFSGLLPSQTKVMTHIDEVVRLYSKNVDKLVTNVRQDMDKTSEYFFSIAGAIGLICLVALIVILTRMSRKEEKSLQDNLIKTQKIAEKLEISSQQLVRYTDALVTFTAMLSVDGVVEIVNQSAVASTGLPRDMFLGKVFHECYWWTFDAESQQQIKKDVAACAAGKRIDKEIRVQIVGENFIHMRFILTPIPDAQGHIINLVAEGQDITERKTAAEKLSYQASHDDLTGLINRLEFEHRLNNLLQCDEDEATHYVFYLDLDQFKVVNDTCGHVAGDELLRQVPQCIQSCIRRTDVLARLGGDEFGIILEHSAQHVALGIAKSIIHAVSDFQFCWEDKTFRIGVSIGILELDRSITDLGEVLKHIDSACYAAKDAGRNCFHQYRMDDEKMREREKEMDWVGRISQALEEDRFELFAQSILPTKVQENDTYNMELLVRMRDKDGSLIMPGAFLPSAERYNKMLEIDRWVIKKAISMLSGSPEFLNTVGYCSINLSCQSLTDEDFLDFLIEQLDCFGGLSEKICLEITETAAISNLSQAMHFITVLRSKGVRFALDDFGSGLSSFAYLKTLPVDYLKIDGMFVKDILDDEMDFAMVKSIHDVASVMGLKTIAEFVENEDILYKLAQIGIDYAQGYGIDKPSPLKDIIASRTGVKHDANVLKLVGKQ